MIASGALAYYVLTMLKSAEVKEVGTVYIRPNGDIDPPTVYIQRNQNSYVLTENIRGNIVIMGNNVVFDGNGHTYETSGTGFRLSGQSNITIKYLHISASENGVHIISATNCTISDNTITNCQKGIYLENNARYNAVIHNTLRNNEKGIDCYGTGYWNPEFNVISGNTVVENTWGMDITYSHKTTISGNNITDNKETGVFLYGSSENTIFQNYVSTNLEGMRFMDFCSNNTSYENTVTNNQYGFYLWQSSNNKFYHNSLTENTNQIWSEGSGNIWDDGYPSGGNYWSDYRERYPNAIELDNSGKWNTPYVMKDNNVDSFPLVSEVSTIP
jgi:parallel beta-helix repeat protein